MPRSEAYDGDSIAVVRLLEVAPREIFPPRRGITVRLAALGGQLSQRHEVRQLTLADGRPRRRRGMDAVTFSPSYTELRRVHPLGALAVGVSNRFWHGAPLLAGVALRASGPGTLAPLFHWPDVVSVVYPWQFGVCRRLAPPGIPCVYSSANVESDKFRSWGEAIGVSRAAAEPWLRYVKRAELSAVAQADLVTAVSEDDRQTFVEHFGADPDRTVVVPNGVDCIRFKPASPEERTNARRELGLPDRPVVLFQGADMPANRAGLEWVRRLAAEDVRFTYLVVGSVATPERSEALVAVGSVQDMRPYLAAADLGICPIAHGGGTKLKLLECMAAGLPAVVFSEAIRGTAARPDEHVLLAGKTTGELTAALATLAGNPDLARSLGTAARDLVVRRYDWAAIASGLEQALSGLCAGEHSGATG